MKDGWYWWWTSYPGTRSLYHYLVEGRPLCKANMPESREPIQLHRADSMQLSRICLKCHRESRSGQERLRQVPEEEEKDT